MNYPRYDYSGHRVAVLGGTQGTGLATAHAFADAGADVTVTGAQHLTGFYDADLSRFRYRSLALDHPEAIVDFAAGTDRMDVLVVASAPELPRHLGHADREFVVEACRLGLAGPAQAVRRLRPAPPCRRAPRRAAGRSSSPLRRPAGGPSGATARRRTSSSTRSPVWPRAWSGTGCA
ncbi:NAD(P)-dependent dehydrogenase (short-subunit alcohol dehydrogenase family) [Nocardioides zeae]|uniref:NAD(P)-dependent dehydrogenase (Short-subunit alcohol dehydrogenase family) n=1 Tax=Nocardioides zeae TaxID=1457234 RepID=A0ACC6IHB8_9ACTN|nr:hypothetical protein [Nocardioides zeae]MDR6172908.1 NAD(P)-dependent dehydrogenase (short-subunit alcohol dehydrogenase family) [Nocardioides zeae]MDR6209902.1 NAD(P)-dependent dehydrogenase (short-subunit alcohol dehydrogenase family) [Nocardioides zeae]